MKMVHTQNNSHKSTEDARGGLVGASGVILSPNGS